MNRIHQFDPAQSTGETKELFEGVKSKLGMTSNAIRVLGNSPAALKGYLGLSRALADGVLSAKLREQLALAVGEINGCAYCLSAHTLSARMAGLSEQEVNAARRSRAVDKKSNGALKLASGIALRRGQIADTDLQAARSAGLSDAEIVEVILHVGLNSMTNYLNNAARTVIDFPEVTPGSFDSETPAAAAR